MTSAFTNVDYHLKEAKFNYPSYSEKPSWFHEKSKHTEDFPISEYTKETKKIVFWNKDFSGRFGYQFDNQYMRSLYYIITLKLL